MLRRNIGDAIRAVANKIDPPRPIHIVLKLPSAVDVTDNLRAIWR